MYLSGQRRFVLASYCAGKSCNPHTMLAGKALSAKKWKNRIDMLSR